MKVLPDTSVWVDYLRRGRQGNAWPLDHLLQECAVVICGPVIAELLAGARPPARLQLWSLLRALPWAPLGRGEWRRVGEIAAVLRDRGMPVPLTDLEIAVSAVTAGAHVWTSDRDFERIAPILSDLQRYQPA
jgi:predicted nucleic acid-binding protein